MSTVHTAADLPRLLNEIDLFSGCSPKTLQRIADICEPLDLPAKTQIYSAGDEALEMYVLLNGLVSFTMGKSEGALFVAELMKRHMIFGWAALVPEHPRRLGSARCLEDSRLIAINGDQLMDVLSEDPRSGFLVMKRLCSMIAHSFLERS